MGGLRDSKSVFERGFLPKVKSSLAPRASFVPETNFALPSSRSSPSRTHASRGERWTDLLPDVSTDADLGARLRANSRREKLLYEQGLAEGRREGDARENESQSADLTSSKQEGYRQGFREGFDEGQKESEKAVEQRAQELQRDAEDRLLTTITESLIDLKHSERTAARKRDMEMMSLMIEILGKILPSLGEAQAEAEVRLFLTSVFERFDQIPSVVITLAPSGQESVARLREHLTSVLSADDVDRLLSFRFDSSLGASDCRVVWAEGEVKRSFHLLWDKIEQALKRHLPPSVDLLDTGNDDSQSVGDKA